MNQKKRKEFFSKLGKKGGASLLKKIGKKGMSRLGKLSAKKRALNRQNKKSVS